MGGVRAQDVRRARASLRRRGDGGGDGGVRGGALDAARRQVGPGAGEPRAAAPRVQARRAEGDRVRERGRPGGVGGHREGADAHGEEENHAAGVRGEIAAHADFEPELAARSRDVLDGVQNARVQVIEPVRHSRVVAIYREEILAQIVQHILLDF